MDISALEGLAVWQMKVKEFCLGFDNFTDSSVTIFAQIPQKPCLANVFSR